MKYNSVAVMLPEHIVNSQQRTEQIGEKQQLE